MNSLAKFSLIAAISASFGYLSHYVEWSSPNTPAWVQGIGSIVAIFVAVAISDAQHEREIERRKIDDQNARASRLLAGCMHGMHVVRLLDGFMSEVAAGRYSDAFRDIHPPQLRVALTSLQAINFDTLLPQDARAIIAVMILTSDVIAKISSPAHINADTALQASTSLVKIRERVMADLTTLNAAYSEITGKSTLS